MVLAPALASPRTRLCPHNRFGETLRLLELIEPACPMWSIVLVANSQSWRPPGTELAFL